jgi:hypothetical protein
VIVPGSLARPHFAGQSFVRVGDSTMVASDAQLNELVAQRNSKARAISEWTGKTITWFSRIHTPAIIGYGDTQTDHVVILLACNPHYCTTSSAMPNEAPKIESFPLNQLEIGFDHIRERLAIYRYKDR